MKLLLTTIFALLTTNLWAITPSELGSARVLEQAPCRDVESGERGFCFLLDHQGVTYLVFHDHTGDALFIRRVRPEGGYEQIWNRNTGSGIVPSGVQL